MDLLQQADPEVFAAIQGEEQPSGQVTASQKSVFGRLRDAFNPH